MFKMIGIMENKVCIDGIWYMLNEEKNEAWVTYSDDEEEKYQGEVVIPDRVEYEDKKYDVKGISGAFSGCGSLTSVTIPKSVTFIGNGDFWGCSNLVSIIVAEDNPIYDSRNGCNAIIETKENSLYIGCATTIIPEGVTSIEYGSFCGCGIKSITIPKSVTEIRTEVFYECENLTSIVVAEGNPKFDSRNGCNAIIDTKTNTLAVGCATTIIPESVTSIEDWAFEACVSLTSITIPASITKIGRGVFASCRNLKDIYCHNFSIDWLEAFDESLIGDITLHVPNHVLGENNLISCNKCVNNSESPLSAFKNIVALEAK